MDIAYRFNCEGVDWNALEALFQAAELGGRKGDKLRRGFENSQLVCFAFDDAQLVGASRVLTDWEYHALIYDVAVLPDYQRRGIGSRMMEELLSRLKVFRVMLVADGEVKDFYRKLGFEIHDEVMARFDWEQLYDAADSRNIPNASEGDAS